MTQAGRFHRAGVHTASDLRERARRRLPKFVFDFIDGAAEEELAAGRNTEAFRRHVLVPRIGARLPDGRLHCLFGQTYAAPFGIAPIGLAELVTPRADLALAKAAARANIPYICSAASGTSVEDIANQTGRLPWFQLYSPRDPRVTDAILDRVDRMGVPVLVVTVDVPVPGKRIRDLRNGLQLPLRPHPRLALDLIRSPRWAFKRIAAGRIKFPNFEQHQAETGPVPFHQLMAEQTGGPLDWEELVRLRERWPRALVLKGVLSTEDATLARQAGMDGVIVSNHGGRQFDAAPAPLDVLPEIRAAIPDWTVMLDSGVQSGADIVKASSAGADHTFIGRPFLYALAAFGIDGPSELADRLIEEARLALTLCGAAGWTQVRECAQR